ncbi:MAG TPA: serine/threonine-protein kinase, partial [Pirellulales bacterium]
MSGTPKFADCAVVSGLVEPDDLQKARAAIAQRLGADAIVSDEELAAQVVEQGCVNRWQAEQLLAGRTKFNLGAYQIIDSIGQGGMGQVFKAEHTIMGRVVAVKVLPRSKSTPDAIANFNREVRTQAQLDHENLVRAHDAGHDGQVHFLVTEYVPGSDLRKLVRAQGPLPMWQAASIIAQAARGLAYAHRRGIIHRDIKPGNILVTPDGRTKVSDLGLASFFIEDDPAGDADPRAKKVVGTADYIAPEQVVRGGATTAASDVYSLGCTLYYSVTGKVPFPGGTPKEKAKAHCTAHPVHPRRLSPGLTAEFCEVIAKMMEKDPAKRPATAEDVMRLLAPWLDDRSPLMHRDRSSSSLTAGDSGILFGGRRGGDASTGTVESSFLVEPRRESGDENSGPLSLSSPTVPVASGAEETSPFAAPDDEPSIPGLLQFLIILGGVVLLLALAVAIALALLS